MSLDQLNLNQLNKSLPKEIISLFNLIESFGFLPAIVGGFSRNYLMSGEISKDIDIELKPTSDLCTKELYKKIENEYKTENLSFNILRISLGTFEIELSLPRKEKFDGSIGHSNFQVEFIKADDYKEGAARRDFTINAIYFAYEKSKFSLVDPFGGVLDLKNKILYPCCEKSFDKDPVRFLRAFRFKIKYDLTLSKELMALISKRKNEYKTIYTSFYLKQEAIKSEKPITFLFSVLDLHLGEDITIYDGLFKDNFEAHLRACPFLAKDVKVDLCKRLSISTKNCLFIFEKTDLKKISFENHKTTLNTLKIIENLNLTDEYLEIVLKNSFHDFDVDDFRKFKSSEYKLTAKDKQSPSAHYQFIILQNRLGHV